MKENRHKPTGRTLRARRRRRLLSTDVGAAALLVLLAASIGIASLKTSTHALGWEAGLGSSESAALRLADFLLKECEWPGLSECDSRFSYSHVLSRSKVMALNDGSALKKIIGTEKNVSAQVIGISGEVIAGTVKATGVCAKRIALLDGREVFLEACSE